MLILAEIFFWGSIFGLVHTYLLYPIILRLLSKGKAGNQLLYQAKEEWPQVSVIMSVYNEALVIEQKLESLIALDYPEGRLQVYIGSDCSSDATNNIVANIEGNPIKEDNKSFEVELTFVNFDE